jgi:LysM repeat protein
LVRVFGEYCGIDCRSGKIACSPASVLRNGWHNSAFFGQFGQRSHMFALRTVFARISAAVLSLATVSTSSTAGSCKGDYTVVAGDTLARIAARCDSSVDAIMRANPGIASPAQIAVGRQIVVPGRAGSDATEDGGNSAEPVSLSGRIINGRRCALIKTADGEEYGVVSPDFAFVNGALVIVRGRVVNDPSCTGPRTLLVDELQPAAPT